MHHTISTIAFTLFIILTNLLVMVLRQVLAAMNDEFNVSSAHVEPWDCNKELEVFSSEGIVKLEIPPQIAAFIAKISYSVTTSVEGMIFSIAGL